MTRQTATLAVLLVLAGFWAGWIVHGAAAKSRQAAERRADKAQAQSYQGARAPAWAALQPCRPATAAEQSQNDAALAALEAFDADNYSLQGAAVRHFATGSRLARSRKLGNRDDPVCPPVALYDQVARAALRADVFSQPFLYENTLALAEQLGPRDPKIVEAVARSAFSGEMIPSDGLRADLRPYARLVLAQLGVEAVRPWTPRALAEMSASDQMGTGAAQIAAASGDPEALAKIQRLMADLLAASPRSKPIPWEERNRLYELAFGLGMAREKAQPYAAPLTDLLSRKVQSWAPPFGMIELEPARMCVVARHIGGEIAASAQAKDFCRDPKAFES